MTEKDFIFKSSETKNIKKGSVTWKSPSNIALVKYWGKSEPQIPKNTSVSFTLNNCHTITTLEYSKKEDASKEFDVAVIFEGEVNDNFKPKIIKFFQRIKQYVPFICDYNFVIATRYGWSVRRE